MREEGINEFSVLNTEHWLFVSVLFIWFFILILLSIQFINCWLVLVFSLLFFCSFNAPFRWCCCSLFTARQRAANKSGQRMRFKSSGVIILRAKNRIFQIHSDFLTQHTFIWCNIFLFSLASYSCSCSWSWSFLIHSSFKSDNILFFF